MPNPPQGLPVYGFETLLHLNGLANGPMLKRHRRRPADGQQPVACYWTGHDYALIYRDAEAVALPPLSPGRQALYDAARTCAECGARALWPFQKGRDGKRYCEPCQGPVHERIWQDERAADRPVVAAWAAAVLADPTTLLGARRGRQFWQEVLVVDLAGKVLLDAKVRYYATGIDERILTRPQMADTVSPAELVGQVAALADRRLVCWWQSTAVDLATGYDQDGQAQGPRLATVSDDHLGAWYARWVGKLSGSSYRYHPALAYQPPPTEPAEQISRMRKLLDEMATGPVVSPR